jgi:hypothetical protein
MIPSKLEKRITVGIVKISLLFLIYVVFTLRLGMAQSNPESSVTGNSKAVSWDDSLSRLIPRTRPVYAGLDVSIGAPQYRINSNIDVLNNLPVNYLGGMAGGVLANPIGKIKGGIGIYYSGDHVPYTFDLLAANLSVNFYLLRIRNMRYHALEPYVLAGISQMKNKFFGYYLADPSTKINRSSFEEPYIGSVLSTHLLVGTGVEYQLENDNGSFMHWYVEVTYGSNLHTGVTSDALSDSVVPASVCVKLGMSFGKYK